MKFGPKEIKSISSEKLLSRIRGYFLDLKKAQNKKIDIEFEDYNTKIGWISAVTAIGNFALIDYKELQPQKKQEIVKIQSSLSVFLKEFKERQLSEKEHLITKDDIDKAGKILDSMIKLIESDKIINNKK